MFQHFTDDLAHVPPALCSDAFSGRPVGSSLTPPQLLVLRRLRDAYRGQGAGRSHPVLAFPSAEQHTRRLSPCELPDRDVSSPSLPSHVGPPCLSHLICPSCFAGCASRWEHMKVKIKQSSGAEKLEFNFS